MTKQLQQFYISPRISNHCERSNFKNSLDYWKNVPLHYVWVLNLYRLIGRFSSALQIKVLTNIGKNILDRCVRCSKILMAMVNRHRLLLPPSSNMFDRFFMTENQGFKQVYNYTKQNENFVFEPGAWLIIYATVKCVKESESNCKF